MGETIGKKEYIDKNVYDAAIERVHDYYEMFDKISVSWSGGKDSTAALEVTIEVARERGELPVEVMFFDEEAIIPETVNLAKRLRERDEVDLKWYCVPLKQKNTVAEDESKWIAWNPERKDDWVREKPEGAIENIEGFGIEHFSKAGSYIFSDVEGDVGMVMGIRADESMIRYRGVARRDSLNHISALEGAKWVHKCKPIYDWTVNDLWTAVKRFGWDYNKYYDKLNLMGISPAEQRVAQFFGTYGTQDLALLAKTHPDIWDDFVARVNGVNTGSLYADTYLYGRGDYDQLTKPDDMTWEKMVKKQMLKRANEGKETLIKNIKGCIKKIYEHTDELDDKDWKWLYRNLIKSDDMGRIDAIGYCKQKYGKKQSTS